MNGLAKQNKNRAPLHNFLAISLGWYGSTDFKKYNMTWLCWLVCHPFRIHVQYPIHPPEISKLQSESYSSRQRKTKRKHTILEVPLHLSSHVNKWRPVHRLVRLIGLQLDQSLSVSDCSVIIFCTEKGGVEHHCHSRASLVFRRPHCTNDVAEASQLE